MVPIAQSSNTMRCFKQRPELLEPGLPLSSRFVLGPLMLSQGFQSTGICLSSGHFP